MTVTLGPPVADDEAALIAFHDERLRYLLEASDEVERGRAATAYITWLDACRVDATAIRDVSVYKLHNDQGLGALRIAGHFGVGKARGQQLIYRSAETYVSASQILAKIKRRLGRG
jgi:hypothetical protein